jgi:hypothetical protein
MSKYIYHHFFFVSAKITTLIFLTLVINFVLLVSASIVDEFLILSTGLITQLANEISNFVNVSYMSFL